jgi:cation diffusion facilitator family transporter
MGNAASSEERRTTLVQVDRARQIALTGMGVSGALALIKISAGMLGHSAVVTADGFESATDVLNSGLVLVGLHLASRPADENHPYGHGRVETLTGLMLGFILVLVGCGISWRALTDRGVETPHLFTVWPLAISIVAKFWLLVVKRKQARQIGSSSLMADAANDAMDMLSGVVAVVALALTLFDPSHFLRADHDGAFIVGLIVIATGLRVMYDSSMHLMDTMPDDASMLKIREVALSVRDVAGVEKCFARKTGFKYHVDLHLEVDPDITVRESHEIATRVREEIRGRLPWVADVLVHVEPFPGV